MPGASALLIWRHDPDDPGRLNLPVQQSSTNTTMTKHLQRLATIYALACTTAAVSAAEPAAAGPLETALTKGKVSLDMRLRYEHVDQPATEADALTLRTRLGYTTGSYYGFTAGAEAQNTTQIVDDYQEPGQAPNGKSVVADPELTEVSQAWIGYANKDYATSAKVGRQVIILDNSRFVGNVGWRQNMQTFDAVSLKNSSIEKLDLTYAYVWQVKRIFGDTALGFTDFDSKSHLFNAAYSGLPVGKLTGYAYLLDLENAAGNNLSSATYGLSLTGSKPVGDSGVTLGYRAEYATQSDYGDNLASYDADYYVAELTAGYKGYSLMVGYEVLGSDGGAAAFQTPLATGHAFNGWADLFLNTPPTGLEDTYIGFTAPIPGGVKLTVVYHDFQAESGGADYGEEWDFVAGYKVNKFLSLTGKVALYKADTFGVDTDKYSLQADFKF